MICLPHSGVEQRQQALATCLRGSYVQMGTSSISSGYKAYDDPDLQRALVAKGRSFQNKNLGLGGIVLGDEAKFKSNVQKRLRYHSSSPPQSCNTSGVAISSHAHVESFVQILPRPLETSTQEAASAQNPAAKSWCDHQALCRHANAALAQEAAVCRCFPAVRIAGGGWSLSVRLRLGLGSPLRRLGLT